MAFAYEREMVAPVERWVRSKGMVAKREFALPWGICDLVACSLNKSRARRRLSLGQKEPIRTHARALVLSAIPDAEEGGSVSSQKLLRELGQSYDASSIRAEVEFLIRRGYVAKTERGGLQKLNGWMPLSRKIIAVELKLARIQDALAQAVAHLEFADESYVALPMERAMRLARGRGRDAFTTEGVGILGVREDECRMLRRSQCPENAICGVMQMLYVDRFWGDYVRGSEA